jgi:hypothetical protein
MRHLLISVSYEGEAIAPSTIFAAIRDRLLQHGREAVEGKAWHSPSFVQPQTGSVWDAWWNLTDPERAMIHDIYPQLHAALYLLHEATSDKPLHKAPVGYPDGHPSQPDLDPSVNQLTEGNPHYHFYNCPARLRDGPCTCDEDSYRKSLADVKIEPIGDDAEEHAKHYYQASNGVVIEVDTHD